MSTGLRFIMTAAILGVSCAGCSRHESAPPAPARPAASAGKASPVAKSAIPSTRAPSFRADILPVLERNCATARGCHGDAPTDSVHLDLRVTSAYDALVGREAEARTGALRINPGDPAHSFLVAKLTGALGPSEGKAMPIDVDTGAPLSPSPIEDDFIHHTLEPWIAAGAPNN